MRNPAPGSGEGGELDTPVPVRETRLVSSASACGKTTVGRALAAGMAVPFLELDALHHGAGWNEAPLAELRERSSRSSPQRHG